MIQYASSPAMNGFPIPLSRAPVFNCPFVTRKMHHYTPLPHLSISDQEDAAHPLTTIPLLTCPLVTRKMRRTHGAYFSMERKE